MAAIPKRVSEEVILFSEVTGMDSGIKVPPKKVAEELWGGGMATAKAGRGLSGKMDLADASFRVDL